jgi:hypothetical protein
LVGEATPERYNDVFRLIIINSLLLSITTWFVQIVLKIVELLKMTTAETYVGIEKISLCPWKIKTTHTNKTVIRSRRWLQSIIQNESPWPNHLPILWHLFIYHLPQVIRRWRVECIGCFHCGQYGQINEYFWHQSCIWHDVCWSIYTTTCCCGCNGRFVLLIVVPRCGAIGIVGFIALFDEGRRRFAICDGKYGCCLLLITSSVSRWPSQHLNKVILICT